MALRIVNPKRFACALLECALVVTGAGVGFSALRSVPEAAPVQLRIPAIDVDAPIAPYTEIEAAQGRDGASGSPCLVDGIIRCIDPTSTDAVAWQVAGVGGVTFGAAPATHPAGTVYLYGHSAVGGEAVFDHLAELQPGDKAVVTTESGKFNYRVERVISVPKTQFSELAEVVDQVPGRLLLVSCDHSEVSATVNGGYSTNNIIAVLQQRGT